MMNAGLFPRFQPLTGENFQLISKPGVTCFDCIGVQEGKWSNKVSGRCEQLVCFDLKGKISFSIRLTHSAWSI